MISGTVQHELEHFDRTMGQYIALSRRTPAEVVAQKGAQIIMGNQSPPFPGLYQGLRRLAPEAGEISAERGSVLDATPRDVRRPVKVRRRARQRADALLAGRSSGLFSISPRGLVKQVRFRKRGDGRIKGNRGGVVRISRRSEGLAGEKVLNRISLAIALELQMRESGRGYAAVSFLPKKYRRMLGRIRGNTRRASQAFRNRKIPMDKALAEGLGSTHEDIVMRNASGEALGRVAFTSRGEGAALRITGFTPPQKTAEAQSIVGTVLRSVSADTATYIDRKLSKTRKEVGPFGK
jgi:hypothetical protein